MHTSPAVPTLRAFVFLLAAALVGGCGGGDVYSYEEGQLFQRFLPTERTVDHHPDSVRALTISETEDKIQYKMDQPYRSLVEKWSADCRYRCGRSYATVWSLELSLASLQPELGILTLHKDRAKSMIQQVRSTYQDTLQVDVYWFRGDGKVAAPGYRAELHVQGDAYRAVKKLYSPLRRAHLQGGGGVTYRRNTFYFPRTEDGADILKDASEMQLHIYAHGFGKTQFVWSWAEDNASTAAASSDRNTSGNEPPDRPK